jgi:hypothetical protein
LNHVLGDTINLQRAIAADDNTWILLPLSGPQPTWRDLRLASCRLKMTHLRHARLKIAAAQIDI